jgi:hypothetical protein
MHGMKLGQRSLSLVSPAGRIPSHAPGSIRSDLPLQRCRCYSQLPFSSRTSVSSAALHVRSRALVSTLSGTCSLFPATGQRSLSPLFNPQSPKFYSDYSQSIPLWSLSKRLPRRRTCIQQTRSCSYRRNMCRAQALDGAGGAVDVSGAREVLPDNVKAVHYHLTLEPNLTTFEYDGEVVIE